MFEVFKEASEKTHGLVEIAGQNYINENIVKQTLLEHEHAVRGKMLKEDIEDLRGLLNEKHVTDKWRLAEVEAIISIKERKLKALDNTE